MYFCVCVCVCVCVSESILAVPHLILSRILWLPICYLKNINFKIYGTLILPDLYECKRLGLSQWGEERVCVPKNKVLRKIFVPKSEKVIGNWRKLHNEVLNNLYASPNIIRMI